MGPRFRSGARRPTTTACGWRRGSVVYCRSGNAGIWPQPRTTSIGCALRRGEGAFELARPLTHHVRGVADAGPPTGEVGGSRQRRDPVDAAGRNSARTRRPAAAWFAAAPARRAGAADVLRTRAGRELLRPQFGYPLGRYESTVDDEYVPYVTPQERAITPTCAGSRWQMRRRCAGRPDEPARFP